MQIAFPFNNLSWHVNVKRNPGGKKKMYSAECGVRQGGPNENTVERDRSDNYKLKCGTKGKKVPYLTFAT